MSFFFLSFLVFFPWIAFSRRFSFFKRMVTDYIGFIFFFTQITRITQIFFLQTDGHGLQRILLFYVDFADGD